MKVIFSSHGLHRLRTQIYTETHFPNSKFNIQHSKFIIMESNLFSHSTIMNFNDRVDYSEEGIVSKRVIQKEKGNVTLFAFDKGQGLSEHTAPFDALVHVLDGESEITISGKTHRLSAGEMIIMPANEPHALKALKRFKMILTMIRS